MINPWECPEPDPEPKTCPTCGAIVTDCEIIDARTAEELHDGHAAQAYANWITVHVGQANVFGLCGEYTLRMLDAFPELTRVRGHYYDGAWGERAHWWLVTQSGDIVDPTASQFPSNGTGVYVPWVEGAEEPCGRCINCGAECFRSQGGDSSVCSTRCGVEITAYLSR